MGQKITTQTEYGSLYLKTPAAWETGTFILVRIFRFGDSLLVYQNVDTDEVYPWDEAIVAVPK